ncbi:uncharacterized protein N7498_002383 [Penicillium cinerascens]|uniref:Bud22 domain-containing protein n=1 Tax=Penicillium cinerascens TaxID=70096 RepID=A0A9W9TB35_9EURO|nr:uncharacterized protein N7498_002383 [Penicillium cinerascens]KAJ5215976.1 hypothetical protein N7498_002383 [Penicillium cinerascens]
MPKRKLSELNGSDDRKLSMKAVRLGVKFDHGVQIISKGLKTARGFERQKLSRREKTVKSQDNPTALSKLAEEVNALKALDYNVTAAKYLFKQLSKTKRIAESPAFKEFKESRNVPTEGPKSTAEANILARLFKSTPVKNVVPNILVEIRKLLGVDETPTGKQGKAEAKKGAGSEEKPTRRKAEESESVSGSEDEQPKRPSTTRDSERDSRPEDDMDVSGDEGSGSDDFAEFDARLAPGSDSEGEEDSDADVPARSRALADDISDSVSRSPSPVYSAADSPPPKKTKASKGSDAPAQSTTFLPSLMMGGYWSGSEEASEGEEAAAPKRKNRMGQQARRALWEKKYGAGANHVQKEMKQQKRSRDSGWDTRKGATDGGRGGRHGERGGFGDRGLQDRPHNIHNNHGGHQSGSGPGQGGRPKGPPKDEGPLHPSWEAKRKLKEQAATATFQGKKVTFD